MRSASGVGLGGIADMEFLVQYGPLPPVLAGSIPSWCCPDTGRLLETGRKVPGPRARR